MKDSQLDLLLAAWMLFFFGAFLASAAVLFQF
jgi:hypothetical protein